MRHRQIDSPLGQLTLVVDAQGVLCGLFAQDDVHRPSQAAMGELDEEIAGEVVHQLGEYFAGERIAFDLSMTLHATQFQTQVLQAVQQIGYGQRLSYNELAAAIGYPEASRAAAAAVGHNPIMIIIPGHRVLSGMAALSDDSPAVVRKRWLLEHESRVAARLHRSEQAG